jgi:hypothetical protein
MIFLSLQDFTAIPQNSYNVSEIEEYIERYERPLIEELLGGYLAELFINDYQGNDTFLNPDYQYIYDEFRYYGNPVGTTFITSFGMKKMLINFVTFYYLREYDTKKTISGMKKLKGELSEQQGLNNALLIGKYNDAVITHNSIIDYIEISGLYPQFSGKRKSLLNYLMV